MLFKIQKGNFSRRKIFVFFSYSLFCRSKEAKRMTVRTSRVRHFHQRAIKFLTTMTRTQTTTSITTKNTGLLLSTECVNTLKTANSWLDIVVCNDSGSTLQYSSINWKAHANNHKKLK